MIRIDFSGIKGIRELDVFGAITDQLIDQAGVYSRRETKGTEPGQEVLIGENMNIYADYTGLQVWILKKSRIDG